MGGVFEPPLLFLSRAGEVASRSEVGEGGNAAF
jgi:hypothetical protein